MSQKDISYAVTIGFFDGVHQGHRFLVEQLKRAARERGLATMVITFARHPRQVLQANWQPQLLSTLAEKQKRLLTAGVDRVEVLDFNQALAQLSARDFMAQVLKERLHAALLLTGYDNRFGRGRQEGFDDYANYGQQLGIEVLEAKALTVGDSRVSSSRIRQLLNEGAVSTANACLGYTYRIEGQVVHGQGIGRQLGFPTANVEADDPCKLVPQRGVYAVKVKLDGEADLHPGMMNIGRRPTFDNGPTSLEVHLLDYHGNLYGQRVGVDFVARVRDERTFDTPEALMKQMNFDKEQVIQLLK